MLEFAYPEHKQLYDYWDTKRGDRFAPGRKDIDPIDFPCLLPNLCLYKVHRDPLRYEATLMGTKVVEIWGIDYTGKFVEDIILGPVYDQVTTQFKYVVTHKEPTLHDLDASWLDKDYIKYSRLMLPLSDNGTDVTRLLVSILLKKKNHIV
ncbi:PAS domain-containing protein [Kiloniella majae]|uniref:PAS domain-containing protein n=1 Tax=Kiloniella majae TaxID=1938558 RepID=UPI0015C50417|nr:PAS domain-containing protein [Kiloniella majae]